MKKTRRSILVLLATVVALGSGIAYAQLKEGAKAPDFTLNDINGKTFKLKPLISPGKDQKAAVVLTFWATWCPPCRLEAPHLQKLHEQYSKKNVAVVGVAISENDLNRIKKFAKDNKLTYALLWDADGTKAAAKYDFSSIPTMFIIDGKGVIRATHTGFRQGMEKQIAKELDGILAERDAVKK